MAGRAPTQTERLVEKAETLSARGVVPRSLGEFADDLRRMVTLVQFRTTEAVELEGARFTQRYPESDLSMCWLEVELHTLKFRARAKGSTKASKFLAFAIEVRVVPEWIVQAQLEKPVPRLLAEMYTDIPDNLVLLHFSQHAERLGMRIPDVPTLVEGEWQIVLYRGLALRLPHHVITAIEQGWLDPDIIAERMADDAVPDPRPISDVLERQESDTRPADHAQTPSEMLRAIGDRASAGPARRTPPSDADEEVEGEEIVEEQRPSNGSMFLN
jgi:hypothetical protein